MAPASQELEPPRNPGRFKLSKGELVLEILLTDVQERLEALWRLRDAGFDLQRLTELELRRPVGDRAGRLRCEPVSEVVQHLTLRRARDLDAERVADRLLALQHGLPERPGAQVVAARRCGSTHHADGVQGLRCRGACFQRIPDLLADGFADLTLLGAFGLLIDRDLVRRLTRVGCTHVACRLGI